MSKEKTVMKDVIGREIEVGQIVAFICNGYRGLTVGQVEKLTAQKIRIGFTDRRYGPNGEYTSTTREPGDIAVLEGEAVTFYLLSHPAL